MEKQGSTTTATYTYGNSLLRKDSEFPLFDGQGSERTVTNVSQSVQGSISYDAFGFPNATSGSSSNAYMFGATSGYRSDGDSGLILVGCRYYDPQVGRFVTRDTDLSEHPYIYCSGDPVNYTDPDGHQKNDNGTIVKFIPTPFGPFPVSARPSPIRIPPGKPVDLGDGNWGFPANPHGPNPFHYGGFLSTGPQGPSGGGYISNRGVKISFGFGPSGPTFTISYDK